MSERYQRIYSLPGNLYSEGAPVLLKAGALFRDTEKSRMLVQLNFKNLSRKRIASLTVELRALLHDGAVGDKSIDFTYGDLSCDFDGEFGKKIPIFIKSPGLEAISVKVARVTFSDGGTWEYDGSPLEPVKARRKIEKLLTHPYQIKAYRARFGNEARFVAEKYKGTRICTCGKMNPHDADFCARCGAEFAALGGLSKNELYTEGEYLTAVELLNKKSASDKRRARELLCELGSYRDSEELLKRCDEELAALSKKSRKRRKIVAASVALLLIVVIGLAGSFVGISSSGAWLEYEKLEDGSGYAVVGAMFDDEQIYTVPESYLGKPVVKIGDYAFSYCSELKEIKLPASVSSIGASAFYYCENLEFVNMEGVTEISEFAFAGCTTLSRVDLSDKLVSIGRGAFRDCPYLKSVNVPNSTTEIGYGAFENCDSLESVTLPFVGDSAYSPVYGIGYIFGILDNDDYGYYMPESLTTVSVTGGTIRANAFSGCDSIKTVNVQGADISGSAFENCSSIELINISSEIDTIWESTFLGCTSLKTVNLPDSVELICRCAFQGCTSLESIKLSEGVSIGSFAFKDCTALSELDGSIAALTESAFEGCKSLKSVKFSEDYLGEAIPPCAFSGCESLETVTIPEGVTAIESAAFDGCTALSDISFPSSLVVIRERAFRGISAPVLNFNDGLISIGANAFRGCTSLSGIVLPSSIREVGYCAFADCTSIESYTAPFVGGSRDRSGFLGFVFGADSYYENKAFVPESLKSLTVTDISAVGEGAFYECYKLNSISLPDKVGAIGARSFAYCLSLTTLKLSSAVTKLPQDAFLGCTALRTLTLPGAITSIGDYCFKNCTSLESISIPETLTYIGREAFAGCAGLSSELVLPSGLLGVGFAAFRGVSLTSLTLPFIGGAPDNSESRYFGYIFGAEGAYENGSYVPYGLASVTLTGAYDVPASAFSGCAGLKSVTMPEGARAIGGYAFARCASLEAAVIPSTVTDIYGRAFEGCGMLQSVSFPDGLDTIGDYAFSGCVSFKSVTVPASVRSIGEGAFYDCDAVESISLPFAGNTKDSNYYTHFGYIFGAYYASNSADYVPEKLKSVSLTAASKLADSAFLYCSNIESITLNSGITSIGGSAFSGCASLKSISVPESVTYIGGSAFYNCRALEKLYFNAKSCQDLSSSAEPFGYAGSESGGIEIIVGKKVERIPAYLCYNYYSYGYITKLSFVEGSVCKSIGKYAFYSQDKLSSVDIPESVETIGERAFYYCDSIGAVYLYDTVSSIGTYAFDGSVISCEAESKPDGWSNSWFTSGTTVYWGCTESVTYRFVTNGGAEIADIVAKGAINLPTPVREGYAFLGWYENEDFTGTHRAGAYHSESGAVLYALWVEESLTGSSYETAIPMLRDVEYTATVKSGGYSVYFKFVPSASGSYTFKSLGGSDTYGYLYDSGGNSLRSHDGNTDFSITYTLTAGETYYLRVKFYSSYSTGSFKVKVD